MCDLLVDIRYKFEGSNCRPIIFIQGQVKRFTVRPPSKYTKAFLRHYAVIESKKMEFNIKKILRYRNFSFLLLLRLSFTHWHIKCLNKTYELLKGWLKWHVFYLDTLQVVCAFCQFFLFWLFPFISTFQKLKSGLPEGV